MCTWFSQNTIRQVASEVHKSKVDPHAQKRIRTVRRATNNKQEVKKEEVLVGPEHYQAKVCAPQVAYLLDGFPACALAVARFAHTRSDV